MSVEKNAEYYESAIVYNEKARDFLNDLAKELEHPVVRSWARLAARQHHEHLIKQKKARYRFRKSAENGEAVVVTEKPNNIENHTDNNEENNA